MLRVSLQLHFPIAGNLFNVIDIRNRMKVFWRNIHLYLGLASGLVILVICFTGSVLVFEKEFQQTLYPERYFVKVQNTRLSLDGVIQKFEAPVKNAQVSSLKVYADPQRSLEVSYIERKNHNKSEKADKKKSEGPQCQRCK